MDEEKLLDQLPAPSVFSSLEFTPQEKAFMLQVLQSVKLGGTYAELVPTMNLMESLLSKLSA